MTVRSRRFAIDVRSEWKGLRLPLSFYGKAALKILKALKFKGASLSILFVDDRKIRRLNRRYLGHDYATDVMAFSHIEKGPGQKIKPRIKFPFLGDVLISVSTAKRQARVYGNPLQYELCFYICHGILHLLGYDDRTKKEALRMEKKQKQLLKDIGISRSG